jgi:regulator of RNase E activity RraA
MSPVRTISEEILEKLRELDTCTVSNAIEQFQVRTRNEGFVNGSIRCIFPQLGPKTGYAVTATIRTSSTPIGGRCYYDRIDWWSYLQSMPPPRFLVVQDVDPMPGVGALFGEIHASIAAALGCVSYLTNGAVRDLPGILTRDFQLFAGCLAVSHSYAHVVEFGEPVEIGGLQINPGDLLHGDLHGVVSVPISIAPDIPQVAAALRQSEKELIDFCASPDFSFPKLALQIQRCSQISAVPDRNPRT